jgi:DNA polymerase delta subunit 1
VLAQLQTLPKQKGDPVIQIGMTMHIYGERSVSYRHVLVLGTSEDISDGIIEVFDTEKQLLLRFCELISKDLDPDIITGYNVFGFDFKFLHGRACENDVERRFCDIGRLHLHDVFRWNAPGSKDPEYLTAQVRASSALGQNVLYYIQAEGRCIVDMMKVVQQDFKLDSFSLDNVSAHFLGERKLPVTPKQIFSMHRGSDGDRRKIAEYCLQDCALCNSLLIKLETVSMNIAMANVCTVPLQFLFLRGQGIKIFSLVMKECLNRNTLVPVREIKKDKELGKGKSKSKSKSKRSKSDDDDDEDEEGEEGEEGEDGGYEGAIVLDPVVGIYIEDPVSVLDYSSLYPSSMIARNISHDCLVLDPAYDNLPGTTYLDVKHDIKEGGQRTCRFAQGTRGILPEILLHLLAQRKLARKQIGYRTVVDESGCQHTGLCVERSPGVWDVTKEDGLKVCVASQKISDTHSDFQKKMLNPTPRRLFQCVTSSTSSASRPSLRLGDKKKCIRAFSASLALARITFLILVMR